MVICKYYRQGNCRYGQYCQYEHINSFVSNKAEFNEDDIALTVAKEVLLAERGEQWLLSCFGPLRERPCIPGMEDMSPEEVRWELYEAQKTGMVEQAKLHFQQLCQDMKAKREALKNPTQETILMLKKILGSSQKGGSNANTTGKPSAFFAASQLGIANNTSTNNVFANKTYNVPNNNPFGGGGFTSSNNTSSIFGKTNNNSASVFGNTATFGNNLGGFGTATNNTSSIFGVTNTSTSFNNMSSNTAAFSASQNNSVFGVPSQNMFGQGNTIFSGTNQLGNAPSTSLFNNPMTSQANTLFSGATTTAANLFGTNNSSAGLQTNSVFGTSTTSSSSVNSGIFSQSKTQVPAFGGAPVFTGVNNYANNTGNPIFGGNQAFGVPAISTSGIFGGSTATVTPAFGVSAAAATTSAFDLNQQSNNNTFGAATSASNVFGGQNINAAVSNSTPFGTPSATISVPFVTNSQQLDSASTNSTQFVDAGFGMAVANSTFGTTETSSNPIFANAGTFVTSNATVANTSPFTTFGNVNASSPFSTTTLTTTTPANPFAPRTQQSNAPFGNVAQSHPGATNISSPFGKSPFNAIIMNSIISDSVYSAEDALTDDEKSMFLAQEFTLGKIPLKPPTKDLR
ncbi:uncharacterized protein [Linepithema humile]|uniref:uncharacterized protein n=1 Tax=Linepithema humile TaxID=83485 RepID=UPI0006237872|nr:PREDICTED: nucleoporin-like protein 2 [Linepithema humile]